MRHLCLALFAVSLTGCIPSYLNKYQNKEVAPAATADAADPAAPAGKQQASRRALPTINQIGEGTFRVAMSYDRAWDSLVDILLRNYNLQIVERQSGVITTEWDSYYLDGKVHRNKVSIRLKRLGTSGVELLVHNNVEVLSRTAEGVAEVWLPTDRNKPEIGRLVQNLAIANGLAKPQLSADLTPAPAAPRAQ